MGYGYQKKPDIVDRHPFLFGVFTGFSATFIPGAILWLLTR